MSDPTSEKTTQTTRSFTISDCDVIIQSQGDDGIPVQDFLALAFNLAHSNPNARIDFSLKAKG